MPPRASPPTPCTASLLDGCPGGSCTPCSAADTANHLYLQVVGDGDPHTVIDPRPSRPAPRPAARTDPGPRRHPHFSHDAPPPTQRPGGRLHDAVQRYTDGLRAPLSTSSDPQCGHPRRPSRASHTGHHRGTGVADPASQPPMNRRPHGPQQLPTAPAEWQQQLDRSITHASDYPANSDFRGRELVPLLKVAATKIDHHRPRPSKINQRSGPPGPSL